MKTITIIAVLLLTLSSAQSQKKIDFIIEGMDCSMCVTTAINTLKKAKGVDSVWIDLESKQAIVFGRDQLTEEGLKETLEKETSFEALFKGESLIPPLSEKEKEGLDIQVIEGGSKIRFKDYLVVGKITIFDFYADWCAPCKVFSPKLERLIQSNPNLALRKVDVVDWKSAIAKQLTRDYQLPALPFALIFEENGKLLGKVEGNNIEKVKAILENQ